MFKSFTKKIILAGLFGAIVSDACAQTAQLDAVANESSGQYAPMNMGYAGFNSLGMTQAAWLDPLQNLGEGQSRPAYSKYYWSPDLVLPIRLREGMITLINFPSWEMIEDVFIGDNATFDGQISGPNTVLLYPRKGANVGVDTNVIIFGRSGNRYVFYVKSEAVNTERLTNSIIDIEVIDGNGGDGSKASTLNSPLGRGSISRGGSGSSGPKSVDSTYTRRFLGEDWLKEIPVDPTKFRFDIEVYVPNPEDVVIAPERVWRDDIFTYVDFGNKALNMNQRPIATLIVERLEVPVGFRTKGPNGRLMVIEGIGDIVLRNGKRIICLKLRRGDDEGLENVGLQDDDLPERWDVPAPYPQGKSPQTADVYTTPYPGMGNQSSKRGGNSGTLSQIPMASPIVGNGDRSASGQYDINVGGSEVIVPQYGNGGSQGVNVSYQVPAGMQRVNNRTAGVTDQRYLAQYGYGSGFTDSDANISIELGTDADVSKLETLWDDLSRKNAKILSTYSPFFSVDAPADGQGKELFHLRVGPIGSLEEGDSVCAQLGRNGVFCSVVRTQ